MIPSLEDLEIERRKIAKTLPLNLEISGKPIFIYGAGSIGTWSLDVLTKSGYRIRGFIDSNPLKTGQSINGVTIFDPSILTRHHDAFVFITTRHAYESVAKAVARQNIEFVGFDAWFVTNHFEKYRLVHDEYLTEDRSQESFRAVLMALLTANARYCEMVLERDQYFCLPQFCGAEREVYIDAGAYVGDSVERFIWSHAGAFSKILAFEPGNRQFRALQQRVARLKLEWALSDDAIQVENCGLGNAEGQYCAVSSNGDLQSLAFNQNTGGDISKIISLDDYMEGRNASFVKIDVEGMEMELLRGAEKTIRTCQPKMAVSIYHNPEHMFFIPNYLKCLVPEYHFAIRHHAPQNMETILYAWVPNSEAA